MRIKQETEAQTSGRLGGGRVAHKGLVTPRMEGPIRRPSPAAV